MVQVSKVLSWPVVALLAVTCTGTLSAQTTPGDPSFESVGDDRRAIQTLLDTYTKAVSTKDQALFETLLLNKAISFSDADSAVRRGSVDGGTHNYGAFRKGVFEGAPFRQAFKDVKILQAGPLAQVSLVFVNTDAAGSTSGWKTLQLLKVGGRWKIASEFYT
ncbi:nuclear transport factor 2 family protein [Glacieibacterium megasporae]|uniref:nuclear transport factor 2 family protein n=1 Tax=Glacieibacterium megasporae TaxID=2835787 RepID=UPI001C1E58DD|nr:nuclear transport factor 2 family protein [Polymorphobacter megasporae]UAJ09099.1 nuclear transport factor 2 family protein [Polymorphobacter megasporae]